MDRVRQRFVATCCLFLLSGFQSTVQGGIVWDNGGPNQASADSLSELVTADDFSLLQQTGLTSFQFWDVQLTPGDYAGSILWSIYTNNSGQPGSVLASGSASGGSIIRTLDGAISCCPAGGPFPEWVNTVSIAASISFGSADLAAGTYWLALHDGPISNAANPVNFYWETADLNGTNTPTNRGMFMDPLAPPLVWISTLKEHAFNVSSTAVPEPASGAILAMAGLGLVVLGIHRRGRKESKRGTR